MPIPTGENGNRRKLGDGENLYLSLQYHLQNIDSVP